MNPFPSVCILITGHFRNWESLRPFWTKFKEQHGDIDLYVQTWNESGHRDKKNWITRTDPPDFMDIIDTIRPIDISILEHDDFFDEFSMQKQNQELYYVDFPFFKDVNDFTKCIKSQFFTWAKCFELVTNYQEYDIIVKLRADSVLDIDKLLSSNWKSFVNDETFMTNSVTHRHAGGGKGCLTCDERYPDIYYRNHVHTNNVCDIMFYGNPSVMKRVCSMYYFVDELLVDFDTHNKKIRDILGDTLDRYLTRYHNVTGMSSEIYDVWEDKDGIRCFLPECFLRHWMQNFWILSDPSKMTTKIIPSRP